MQIWKWPVFLGLFCAYLGEAADIRWSRMQSENFELYTSAGDRSARDTLRYFEQVRSFFDQASGATAKRSSLVRIVAFNSKKEYEPYRPNEFAAAFYAERGGRDYIVLGSNSADTFPVAVHEYVHLFVRHSGLNLPPWLNEGLAELYSTLRPIGDKVVVGNLILGRHQALLAEKWVPLEVILGADHKSPYYNEKNKAGSLYNEGWALVHMLGLTPEYRPRFSQLLNSIGSGTSSVQALAQVYGKTPAALDKELQAYLRGNGFRGALIDIRREKTVLDKPAEPAPAFDLALLLTGLADRPGNEDETQKKLEQLTREFPQRPEAFNELGYLAWRSGEHDEAVGHFKKAFELGDRSPTLLWDYGRMVAGSDLSASSAALSELLTQEPSRMEVRLQLASNRLVAKQPGGALATLGTVKSVSPDDAPRLFRILAYAQMQLGGRDEARTSAQRWAQVSKNPQDKSEAERLLNFLETARSQAAPPEVAFVAREPETDADSDDVPALRRREGPPERSAALTTRRPAVEGLFVELRCDGPQAKVVVQVAAGRKVFAIEDPSKITEPGATRDLTCGPQQPASPVRVEYDPPAGDQAGIDGIVRLVRFGP